MGKCCGNTCACKLSGDTSDTNGHSAILITGTGTQQDPFILHFRGFSVINTDLDVALGLTYDETNGFVLGAAFALTSSVDHLGDVDTTGATNGQVLAWNNTLSKWKPVAPTTAAAGTVHTNSSLTGDGSVGTPLNVAFASGGGLENVSGLKLTSDIFNQIVRHFVDDADRASLDPTPDNNSLSMLDSEPGRIDWFDGTDWLPALLLGQVTATEAVALSGSYDGRPVTLFVKQLTTTTAADGTFQILSSTDLASAAGVLSVHITPTGATTQPFIATADTTFVGAVGGVAYAVDGTGILASSTISMMVTAYLY